MHTTAQSARRPALIVGFAAILVMAGCFGITYSAPDATSQHIANRVGYSLAPGPNGGEVTRGNQSGSFAPTSTNDLITPATPVPGSPWRD